MIAVGVLAASFAFLPWILSGFLAIAIFGVLLLKGLRVPVVTEWGGLWCWLPWGFWCLLLAACPLAMFVVASIWPYDGLPPFARTRPWAARLVDALTYAHLVASVVASIAVVVLVREGFRWLAWGAIVVILVFAGLVSFGATMATTGQYL